MEFRIKKVLFQMPGLTRWEYPMAVLEVPDQVIDWDYQMGTITGSRELVVPVMDMEDPEREDQDTEMEADRG